MQDNYAIRIEDSNGNVFTDLGFGLSEHERLKARLIMQIHRTIKERSLTQARAGEILGIRQPHVSGLMRGKSVLFSIERLLEFLTVLGYDIEISVRPARKTARGKMSIIVR